MSTEIAIQQESNSLAVKMEYAQALAHSALLPQQYRNNPANLLFALEYAEALHVAPIHAITSIHVINGKPAASADLIAATIRRAGHKLRVTGDDTYAEAVLIRADDITFEYKARWDMDKARKAGLNTATWKAYPAAMLRSRAITEVARMGASDALFGVIYTPEELGASVDGDGVPVITTAPFKAAPQAPAPQQGSRIQRAMNRQPAAVAEPEPAVDEDSVLDEAPAMATPEQIGVLMEGLTQAGHEDGIAKQFAISGLVGRDVTNPHDLTWDEAEKALTELVGDVR